MDPKRKRGKKPAWTQNDEQKLRTSPPTQSMEYNPQTLSNFVERLNLRVFKVVKCTWKNQHNYRTCIYYHGDQDKRRNHAACQYEPEMCEHLISNRECPQGDRCSSSHSMVEKAYHPDKYRKKFCSYFPHDVQSCPYGKFCSYAHSEEEIQTELLHNLTRDDDFFLFHFKTTFCPYSCDHDRSVCVYAHNWQDYRRSPVRHTYSPNPCSHWDRTKKIVHYENACPKGFDCSDSHGWKELDFHPARFRKTPCKERNCRFRESSCPHYHREFNDSIAPNPPSGFEVWPSNRSSKFAMVAAGPLETPGVGNWSRFDTQSNITPSRSTGLPSESFPNMTSIENHNQYEQQYYYPMRVGVSLQEFGYPRYPQAEHSYPNLSSSGRPQPKSLNSLKLSSENPNPSSSQSLSKHATGEEADGEPQGHQHLMAEDWGVNPGNFGELVDSGQTDPGSHYYTGNNLHSGGDHAEEPLQVPEAPQFMPQYYMVETANGVTVPSHASEHNTFNTEANRQSLLNSWKNNFKSVSSPLPQIFPGEGLVNDLMGIPAHIHIKKQDSKARDAKGNLINDQETGLNVGMVSNPLDYLKMQQALEFSQLQRDKTTTPENPDIKETSPKLSAA